MNAYLFDLDGTLIDSMPTFVKVMLRILDEYHVSYERDVIKTITPMGYAGAAGHFVKLGVPMSQITKAGGNSKIIVGTNKDIW